MTLRKTRTTLIVAGTTLLLMPLLLLSGCSTCQAYPGPKRALEEVGILRIQNTKNFRIDELPITQSNVREINLLPGPHSIAWEYTYPNLYREEKQLDFEVERGHRYQLVQRFIPLKPVGHPLETVFDLTIDAVVAPLIWLFPPELPKEAPEGEYFTWIVDVEFRNVLAGESPDSATRQASISESSMSAP